MTKVLSYIVCQYFVFLLPNRWHLEEFRGHRTKIGILRKAKIVICIILVVQMRTDDLNNHLNVREYTKLPEEHNKETMGNFELKFNWQYHLSSSVRKWQNTFQQGVVSSDVFLGDKTRRPFKYPWCYTLVFI